jgi:AmmeMemoRadiSam system protein B/AmmeMemoRadiSam system protein A
VSRSSRRAGFLLIALAACVAAVFFWPDPDLVPPAVVPEPVAAPEPIAAPEPAATRKPVVRDVLESSLAGRWYTNDPAQLATELQGFLDRVQPEPLGPVRALILPHAGYRWSGQVAAHGVKQVVGHTFHRVVVLGPSHRSSMENVVSVPAATHYATPLGEVALDLEFISALRRHPVVQCIPPVHANEHSVQIQVPLLQQALHAFRLVPIVIGNLDPETSREFARILRGLIDPQTLVIASSDFTHYGSRFDYRPFHEDLAANIQRLDMGALATIEKSDAEAFRSYVEETGATICGRRAISVLLAMVGPDAEARLLRYDTSGRQAGDHTNSVSYLAIAFPGTWPDAAPVAVADAAPRLSAAERERLLDLARRTLAYVFEHESYPTPEQLGIEITAPMRVPGGAFVTLHKGGRMCGCRGQIYPSTPLYRTVMIQTVQSALYDRRFRPTRADELPALHLTISVLTQPRPVASAKEIVLGKHGIILRKGQRSALYLPQVAPEQGWNLEQTLSSLSRKAGLPDDAWKDGTSFSVFEAEVFGEPER